MTEKHFQRCVDKGIPFYKIWVGKFKFHQKKCSLEEAKPVISWINKDVPYNTSLHCYMMYASGDRLKQCKKKLYNYLKQEHLDAIKKANKALESLKKLEEELL